MMTCRWIEAILAIVIIVFAWKPEILPSASMWIIIVSAVLLLVHALFCKRCKGICMEMMKQKPARGRRRRRR